MIIVSSATYQKSPSLDPGKQKLQGVKGATDRGVKLRALRSNGWVYTDRTRAAVRNIHV